MPPPTRDRHPAPATLHRQCAEWFKASHNFTFTNTCRLPATTCNNKSEAPLQLSKSRGRHHAAILQRPICRKRDASRVFSRAFMIQLAWLARASNSKVPLVQNSDASWFGPQLLQPKSFHAIRHNTLTCTPVYPSYHVSPLRPCSDTKAETVKPPLVECGLRSGRCVSCDAPSPCHRLGARLWESMLLP